VVVLAWLFAAGVVVQVFLAGLSVFDSPARWPDHVAFGRLLGLIPPPLILLALAGRLPLGLIVMAALVLVMYGMQYLFANTGAAYLAAFHPVNAFVLLGLSAQLGQRTRRMMVPPAPSEESARRAAEGRITR
jgi:hypothetical protein